MFRQGAESKHACPGNGARETAAHCVRQRTDRRWPNRYFHERAEQFKAQEPAQAEAARELFNRTTEMTAHDPEREAANDGLASTHRREAAKPRSREDDAVAAFAKRAMSAGASSEEVAEVIAKAFQDIARVLVPIVGQRGMAALYRRSLHLAGPACAQVSVPIDGVHMAMDTAPLQAELAKQTAVSATAAGTELLQAFYVLLAKLIGESLTERLLRPVWATFLSGSAARDTQP
ncbi:MAG: hypothetical protein ABI671_19470 [Burkholderiales bacterium]